VSSLPPSREERANRIRPRVTELAERLTWAKAAELLGVSKGAIQNILAGSTPQERILASMEQGLRALENVEERPEDVGREVWPDVSMLKPKARAFYFQTLKEWSDQEWTSGTASVAARDMTNFFRGDSTQASEGPGRPGLDEQTQLDTLRALRKAVEQRYGPGGPDSKR
jgi:hypothetical protein